MKRQQDTAETQSKAPSGRELAPQVTEGERGTMNTAYVKICNSPCNPQICRCEILRAASLRFGITTL